MAVNADAPRYRMWPPLALAIPFVAGFLLDRLWPLRLAIPARGPIAGILFVAFAILNGSALAMMARARTGLLPGQAATRILDTGPFGISRNPLYVGLILLYVALAVWIGSDWALVLSPVAALALHFGAVLPEERYLLDKFVDAYRSYMRRVRRWL